MREQTVHPKFQKKLGFFCVSSWRRWNRTFLGLFATRSIRLRRISAYSLLVVLLSCWNVDSQSTLMLLSTPPLLVGIPSEHIFRPSPTVSARLQILKEIILEAGRGPHHTVCEVSFTAT